ncbi:MAG: hypothetical protein Q7S86_02450 [bacterium]|nr:hypothetical protein [bacterium]
MPTKTKIYPSSKLTNLGPEHRATFEQRIEWGQILDIFEVPCEEDGDNLTVFCPYCELSGDDVRVTLSPNSLTFRCVKCETRETKLEFVIGRFSHEPTVSEILELFGVGCFG